MKFHDGMRPFSQDLSLLFVWVCRVLAYLSLARLKHKANWNLRREQLTTAAEKFAFNFSWNFFSFLDRNKSDKQIFGRSMRRPCEEEAVTD